MAEAKTQAELIEEAKVALKEAVKAFKSALEAEDKPNDITALAFERVEMARKRLEELRGAVR